MFRFLLTVAALSSVFGFAGTAEARSRNLPPGSYAASCRNLYVEGTTLYGECENSAGKFKKTWISGYEYCDGDIYNNDGVLDCNGGRKTLAGDQPPPPNAATSVQPMADNGGLPPGPWLQSCRDAIVDGSILRASCQDNRGKWRPTWIDTHQCQYAIDNDDGLLVCIAAPPPPQVLPMRDTLPSGSWVESCRSAAVKSFQLRAECYAGDGQWLITDLNLKKCGGTVSASAGKLSCD